MHPVESSIVDQVGHDPDTNLLRVRFHSGKTYDYADVPADIADAVIDAPSVGTTLGQLVLPHYPYRRTGTTAFHPPYRLPRSVRANRWGWGPTTSTRPAPAPAPVGA